MQKYILGARLTYQDRGIQVLAGPTAMRRAFDADGKVVGEWQDCNAMTVVDATEHDAALAAKDRDLADANHALLLANNSADAFRRVAEQRQAEIERLKTALRVAISDIESWHEALDEAAGLPTEASVLPALRSALAAADRQPTETERFNRAYERNALIRGQYDPDENRLTLPAGSGT